ncbi:hypothetical protein [Allorhodopirellula heiligendammensis]|uniref:Uncharacterized protein n=1 Tax=Allorhodopirellula heiligendammensis TaxID=2714739 RepID=A0A5C6BXS3_9BACT|nr:hypothetical protein [Allorhodopirellula heiligendammensis]TWU16046.1 hypothetical protein Poly21_32510 [Allorhodopirellula heiligendammensis]
MNQPHDTDDVANTSQSPDSETLAVDANDGADVNGGNAPTDEGPGCLPAIVAGTLLLGIAAAVICGVTTWILFQKRSEIAVRTLQGFVPMIEQSLLEPHDKAKVIEQFEGLIKEIGAPDYPPTQAAAIMQRVVRLPITHWGELDAIEMYIQENFEDPDKQQAITELSRVRSAIQTNQATVFDIIDVVEPVVIVDEKTGTRTLKSKIVPQDVRGVILRAKILADRAKIEDKRFPRIEMSTILRQEIKTAKTEGGF